MDLFLDVLAESLVDTAKMLPFFLVKGGWGGRIQAENARCPLFGERAFSIGVENRD